MSGSSHPCGALPVRGWSIALWWCPTHQAWWGRATRYVQEDAMPESLGHHRVEFGPFDDPGEVWDWADGILGEGRGGPLPSPGMP